MPSLAVTTARSDLRRQRNDRVIARLSESKLFAQLDHINQLGEKFVIEMSSFFSTYKQLRGQSYTVLRVGGPERAADLIEQAAKEFASSPNGSG